MSDFYGIDLRGRIMVPSLLGNGSPGPSTTYELWLGGGAGTPPGSPNPLPAALTDLSYVQDIQITLGLSLNSKISLTLTPPVEEGLEIIHSPLLSWAASYLEIEIGYSTGGDSPGHTDMAPQRFAGLMQKPDVKIGTSITITLNALGVGYGLNLSHAATINEFPSGFSYWDAVQKTFLDLGYTSVNDLDQVFGNSIPSGQRVKGPGGHPFFQTPTTGRKVASPNTPGAGVTGAPSATADQDEVEVIKKGPRNDWWFIRETLKNFNLNLIIRDQQVLIRDPQTWKLDVPKYTFSYRGGISTAIDSVNKVFPILEFNTPSAFVWLAPGSGGLLISGADMDKKQELEVLVADSQKLTNQINSASSTPGSQLASDLGIQFVTDLTKGATSTIVPKTITAVNAQTTRTNTGVPSGNGNPNGTTGYDATEVYPGTPTSAAVDATIAEYRNYNHDRGIQAEIQTIGVPELLPGQIAEVTGIAPVNTNKQLSWFDGNYGIMVVEHTIGTGGMSTKFKGVKNFVPQQLFGGDLGIGQVNNSAAPDPSSISSQGTVVNSTPQ